MPSFFRAALVAWVPAPGATGYEVQWSRTKYPWKSASTTPFYTAATSVLLEGLEPGTWYYRVRGIDPYVPGPVKELTWSTPVEIRLVKPSFAVKSESRAAAARRGARRRRCPPRRNPPSRKSGAPTTST